MNSIQLKIKELLMYHCGCHGNLVIIAMKYAAVDTFIANMDSLRLKTKELLIHRCSCHGNLVTIATRYVADSYCPNKPPYQIWT